jgi:hypothetical protein
MLKAKQLGRPTGGPACNVACRLDEPLFLDQPAEILFVQPSSGESFERPLKLQERKAQRHELKQHWTVFDFGPQASYAGGKDAPMIERHRVTKQLMFGLGPSRTRLSHEPSFVEEFVALEHKFLVPGSRISAEGGVYALSANSANSAVTALSHPFSQPGHDPLCDQGRHPLTPVLPGQVSVPALPSRDLVP